MSGKKPKQVREDALYEQSGHRESQTLEQKLAVEVGIGLDEAEARPEENREDSPGRASNASRGGNPGLFHGERQRNNRYK